MSAPASSSASRRTIVGRYTCVPNPVTTQPALPGLAYAVQTDDAVCFLTAGNRLAMHERAWSGVTPAIGEAIAVTGAWSEHRDLRGEPYCTIEVESLRVQP